MFITLESDADHMPPMKVMPINTMALTIMPLLKSNTSGIMACRMLPPAMYCSEIITS